MSKYTLHTYLSVANPTKDAITKNKNTRIYRSVDELPCDCQPACTNFRLSLFNAPSCLSLQDKDKAQKLKMQLKLQIKAQDISKDAKRIRWSLVLLPFAAGPELEQPALVTKPTLVLKN